MFLVIVQSWPGRTFMVFTARSRKEATLQYRRLCSMQGGIHASWLQKTLGILCQFVHRLCRNPLTNLTTQASSGNRTRKATALQIHLSWTGPTENDFVETASLETGFSESFLYAHVPQCSRVHDHEASRLTNGKHTWHKGAICMCRRDRGKTEVHYS